jgi:glucosamine--fructose-6-phosphate aminotransferase (isomerizing)
MMEANKEELSSSRVARILRHLQPKPLMGQLLSQLASNETCGIVAFTSKTEPCVDYLLEGLTILENRGYDSAGIATLESQGGIACTKYASSHSTPDAIARLRKHKGSHQGTTGVAHTRWATHGGKTDKNAHPHCDAKDRIALVHNGVITNSEELKKSLEAKGIHFRSETDTEVIAQLIGAELDEGKGILEAIKAAESKLEGTWGVVLISKDRPDEICAFKNGSPLLVGISKGRMWVASEPAAFSQHTKEYIALENGEIAVIRPDGHSLDLSRVELAPNETIPTTPFPFEHWTLKEIMEQPEAISRSLNYGGRFKDETKVKLGGLDANEANLRPISHLMIAACGTSYHAGLFGAQLMRSLHSFETVQVVDAAEVTTEAFPKRGGGLLVLSQSGETKDVHRVVVMANELQIPTFSIINVVGSLIARTTKCGAYLNVGREHAVASTKAFTATVTVLALVAIWFSQIRGTEEAKRRILVESLHRLPISLGIALNSRESCRRVAAAITRANSCFVLGKGLGESIAREGALKIKEISYLHAEGTSGGALKHGPFALIEPNTPIIMIIIDDKHAPLMKTAAEEVKARGAFVVVITNEPRLGSKVADEIIKIPNNGELTALLAVIPLQFIAYELTLLRGHNPDKPRNLAKTITVD